MTQGNTEKIASNKWDFYQEQSGRGSEYIDKLSKQVGSFIDGCKTFDTLFPKLQPASQGKLDSNGVDMVQNLDLMRSVYFNIAEVLQSFEEMDESAVKRSATLDQSKLRQKYKAMQACDNTLSEDLGALLFTMQDRASSVFEGKSTV